MRDGGRERGTKENAHMVSRMRFDQMVELSARRLTPPTLATPKAPITALFTHQASILPPASIPHDASVPHQASIPHQAPSHTKASSHTTAPITTLATHRAPITCAGHAEGPPPTLNVGSKALGGGG